MAREQFGGLMSFETSTGVKMKIRGDFTMESSRLNNEVVTNQDGSNTKTIGLKPYRLACTFERKTGVDFDSLLLENGINVTVVETHAKRRHLLTAGFFEGTPSEDRNTGAVTGLNFVSDKYRQISR